VIISVIVCMINRVSFSGKIILRSWVSLFKRMRFSLTILILIIWHGSRIFLFIENLSFGLLVLYSSRLFGNLGSKIFIENIRILCFLLSLLLLLFISQELIISKSTGLILLVIEIRHFLGFVWNSYRDVFTFNVSFTKNIILCISLLSIHLFWLLFLNLSNLVLVKNIIIRSFLLLLIFLLRLLLRFKNLGGFVLLLLLIILLLLISLLMLNWFSVIHLFLIVLWLILLIIILVIRL
jgi:hypothetical protein